MDGDGGCHTIGAGKGNVMGCACDVAGGIYALDGRLHGAINGNELPVGATLKIATDLVGDPAVEGNLGAYEQRVEGTEATVLELDGGQRVLLAQ